MLQVTAPGPIESAKGVIGKRPAETATAAAAAVGLLLSGFLGDGDELRTGLVVLLAALPALVSYIHDLGLRNELPHDFAREVEELAQRSVRRARVGHEGWQADCEAATSLAGLARLLGPPPEKKAVADPNAGKQP